MALDWSNEAHLLVHAACNSDLEALRRLIAAGANPNEQDRHGTTPLQDVVSDLCDDGYEEVSTAGLVELLRLGADPRLLDNEGAGPLTHALYGIRHDVVRILLDAGADPNLECDFDSSVPGVLGLGCAEYAQRCYDYDPFPEPPTDADRATPDAWIAFLDHLAIAHGKPRPVHIMLLRERGAKSREELLAVVPSADIAKGATRTFP
jgi:hypothetical protein